MHGLEPSLQSGGDGLLGKGLAKVQHQHLGLDPQHP